MPNLIEINLLPIEDRKVKKDFTFLLETKVVVPTIILLSVGLLYLGGQRYFKLELEDFHKTIVNLDEDIAENKTKIDKIKKLENILQEKEKKNHSLQSINFNKQLWVRILEGLNKALPSSSWINTITQDQTLPDKLTVKGSTYIFSEVAEYIIQLEKCEYFVQIQLKSIQMENSKKVSAFVFDMDIKINLNLGQEAALAANDVVPVAE